MAKQKYIAQNQIQGLTKKPLETGETIELEAEVAAPFVAGGSLKATKVAERAAGGDQQQSGGTAPDAGGGAAAGAAAGGNASGGSTTK